MNWEAVTSTSSAVSVMTLCGFFDGVPKSLEEAAWIDGCGYLQALFQVIVPVIMSGIAATFIFAFINMILKYDIKWGKWQQVP